MGYIVAPAHLATTAARECRGSEKLFAGAILPWLPCERVKQLPALAGAAACLFLFALGPARARSRAVINCWAFTSSTSHGAHDSGVGWAGRGRRRWGSGEKSTGFADHKTRLLVVRVSFAPARAAPCQCSFLLLIEISEVCDRIPLSRECISARWSPLFVLLTKLRRVSITRCSMARRLLLALAVVFVCAVCASNAVSHDYGIMVGNRYCNMEAPAARRREDFLINRGPSPPSL